MKIRNILVFGIVLMLASCKNSSLHYVITYESLGEDRTEYTTEDASSVPGFKVEIKSTSDGKATVYTARISNDNPDYVIKGFRGPFIDDISYKIEEYQLMVPRGMGQLFRMTPPASGRERFNLDTDWEWKEDEKVFHIEGDYPNRAVSMQWCAFASQEDGLYLGSHDPAEKGKIFTVDYDPAKENYSFSINHLFTCFPGECYEIPETRVMHYKGSWHKAADYYRSWYDKNFKIVRQPEWLSKSSGMLLAITKQQNDEVIFDYPEFSSLLCDLAEERGLDILGLFGWAHGGHDRFYPDYLPDPKRGTESELIAQIKAIKERGLHPLLYTNGQLIDEEGTKYWADTGRFATLKMKDGTLLAERWQKYKATPARTHGRACFCFHPWYSRMLNLAKMANAYGADGIVYDQLSDRGPIFCYADNHGHSVPSLVWENDKEKFLHGIREEMDKINPDFLIMTEGMGDSHMNDVNIFFGCACDVYGPSQTAFEERFNGTSSSTWFPEMFEYTFPEAIITLRNPVPTTSRNLSNYALICHLKNEIECRYRPDVTFMKDKTIPSKEDYKEVVGVPNFKILLASEPAAAALYQKQIAYFQNKFSNLLRTGKFMDSIGFSFDSSHNLSSAKAFVDGNLMGVVVWNVSLDQELEFNVTAKGWEKVGVVAPDRTMQEGDKLAPQSICMVLFNIMK